MPNLLTPLTWVDPNIVTGLAFIVILFLLIDTLRFYLPAARSVKAQLRQSVQFLATLKKDEIDRDYDRVAQFFTTKVPLLGHAWREFDESLVKTVGEGREPLKVRNPIDADHFFNQHDLIDNALRLEQVRHLPGIFTGIGILGTFLGIAAGLGKANSELAGAAVTSGAIAEVTRILLGHVAPAFAVSFIAVLVSIIFLYFERGCYRGLSSDLAHLHRQIDRLFPRVTSEELLCQLLLSSQRQEATLNNLPQSIQACWQSMIEKQSTMLEEFMWVIDGQVTAHSGQVEKAIERQSQLAGARVAQMTVELLERRLAAASAEHVKLVEATSSLVKSLEEVKGGLADLSAQTNSYFHQVKVQLDSYYQSSRGAGNQFLGDMESVLGRAVNMLGGTVDEIDGKLEHINKTLAKVRSRV